MNAEMQLDRAAWKRFGPNAERCIVCGHSAEVSITVTAVELIGEKGALKLATDSMRFCAPHALDRFAGSVRTLQTGVNYHCS